MISRNFHIMNIDSLEDIDLINNINSIFLENGNITLNDNYKNEMSVLTLNIRSIRFHFDESILFWNSCNCNYDIIILSGKWLTHFKFVLNDIQTTR